VVCHDQEHVVAAVADVVVDQQLLLLRLLEPVAAECEDVRVRGRVADPAADVSVDYAYGWGHARVPPEDLEKIAPPRTGQSPICGHIYDTECYAPVSRSVKKCRSGECFGDAYNTRRCV